jgi:hypothetical protein
VGAMAGEMRDPLRGAVGEGSCPLTE